jgi:hypothetical protein
VEYKAIMKRAAARQAAKPGMSPEEFFALGLGEQYLLTDFSSRYYCERRRATVMIPNWTDQGVRIYEFRCGNCPRCVARLRRLNFLNFRYHIHNDLRQAERAAGMREEERTGVFKDVAGKQLVTFRTKGWDYDKEGRLFDGRYCAVRQPDNTHVVYALVRDPSAIRVEPGVNPRGVQILTEEEAIQRVEAACNTGLWGKGDCHEGKHWRRPEEAKRSKDTWYTKGPGLPSDWQRSINGFEKASGYTVDPVNVKPEEAPRVISIHTIDVLNSNPLFLAWIVDCLSHDLGMNFGTWLREVYVSEAEGERVVAAWKAAWRRRRGETADAGV